MRKKIILGAVALLLLGWANAFAETTIKAEVDKRSITTDDSLTYKLTIASSEENIPSPEVPSFDGFAIISQAQSSTLSLLKQGPRAILIYVYILAPLKTGKSTIQPGSITMQGKTYSSESFDIEVAQGKTKPPKPEGTENELPQVTL